MAANTPNMGLRQWNLASDHFESTNLSTNWTKVDNHDHTTGNGIQIPTGGLQNLAVTAAKIFDGAVVQNKIADGAVVQAKIADNAVVQAKIANGEVVKAKLGTDALNAFLKLLSPGNVRIAMGALTIPWPGGSILSNTVNIPHGLGTVPIVHFVYMVDQGGTGYCKVAGGTQSSSSLTAQFETVGGFQPPSGNHGTAGWIAIG